MFIVLHASLYIPYMCIVLNTEYVHCKVPYYICKYVHSVMYTLLYMHGILYC